MRNKFAAYWVGLALAIIVIPGAQAGSIGADVNADVDAFGHNQMDINGLLAFSQKNTVYALPMFNQPADDHARYWDNMVEQYQSAQIDFISVWLKGNNQPATFANCVTALNKRELSGRIKIMPFDDNPASWTAMWNFDHGNGYGYKTPFDLSDPATWAYVWDKNLKVFFQNVPDANRYKINGRPVYVIWSGAPAFLSNLNGNGSKLLNYLRQQCRSTFGFNPYIMVSADWVKNDPSSDNPTVVDAVYPWFTPVPGPVYSTWNINTWNGVTMGVCIPQFHISNNADNNAGTWIVDPQHGNTLKNGLSGTVGDGKCVTTFIEGFDDYWENTTLWRARNLDENGNPLGYAQTYNDYPNQRINLVRRHSNNAFPVNLLEEAEGCDLFSGAAVLPGRRNFYRNGSIAIEDTTDTHGGYDVCDGQAGESLRWQEVPIEGTVHLLVRAATAAAGRKMHFVIDGVTYPAVKIPKTGGEQIWTTVDMGTYSFGHNTYHTLSLVWDTSGINVNWWRVQTTTIPDGNYRIVSRQDGNVLSRRHSDAATGPDFEIAPDTGMDSQKWHLHSRGKGVYALQTVGSAPSGASQQWRIAPLTDGFCSLRALPNNFGKQKDLPGSQEWSLIPSD